MVLQHTSSNSADIRTMLVPDNGYRNLCTVVPPSTTVTSAQIYRRGGQCSSVLDKLERNCFGAMKWFNFLYMVLVRRSGTP